VIKCYERGNDLNASSTMVVIGLGKTAAKKKVARNGRNVVVEMSGREVLRDAEREEFSQPNERSWYAIWDAAVMNNPEADKRMLKAIVINNERMEDNDDYALRPKDAVRIIFDRKPFEPDWSQKKQFKTIHDAYHAGEKYGFKNGYTDYKLEWVGLKCVIHISSGIGTDEKRNAASLKKLNAVIARLRKKHIKFILNSGHGVIGWGIRVWTK